MKKLQFARDLRPTLNDLEIERLRHLYEEAYPGMRQFEGRQANLAFHSAVTEFIKYVGLRKAGIHTTGAEESAFVTATFQIMAAWQRRTQPDGTASELHEDASGAQQKLRLEPTPSNETAAAYLEALAQKLDLNAEDYFRHIGAHPHSKKGAKPYSQKTLRANFDVNMAMRDVPALLKAGEQADGSVVLTPEIVEPYLLIDDVNGLPDYLARLNQFAMAQGMFPIPMVIAEDGNVHINADQAEFMTKHAAGMRAIFPHIPHQGPIGYIALGLWSEAGLAAGHADLTKLMQNLHMGVFIFNAEGKPVGLENHFADRATTLEGMALLCPDIAQRTRQKLEAKYGDEPGLGSGSLEMNVADLKHFHREFAAVNRALFVRSKTAEQCSADADALMQEIRERHAIKEKDETIDAASAAPKPQIIAPATPELAKPDPVQKLAQQAQARDDQPFSVGSALLNSTHDFMAPLEGFDMAMDVIDSLANAEQAWRAEGCRVTFDNGHARFRTSDHALAIHFRTAGEAEAAAGQLKEFASAQHRDAIQYLAQGASRGQHWVAVPVEAIKKIIENANLLTNDLQIIAEKHSDGRLAEANAARDGMFERFPASTGGHAQQVTLSRASAASAKAAR